MFYAVQIIKPTKTNVWYLTIVNRCRLSKCRWNSWVSVKGSCVLRSKRASPCWSSALFVFSQHLAYIQYIHSNSWSLLLCFKIKATRTRAVRSPVVPCLSACCPSSTRENSHHTMLMKPEQPAGVGTAILGQRPDRMWHLFSYLNNLQSRSGFWNWANLTDLGHHQVPEDNLSSVIQPNPYFYFF